MKTALNYNVLNYAYILLSSRVNFYPDYTPQHYFNTHINIFIYFGIYFTQA